jgi:uncharacterized membrane protein YbhN (UPF0104 family)
MKSKLEYVWPFIGLAAVVFSIYLLSKELHGVHIADVWAAIVARGPFIFLLCVLSTLLAYAALAWYDRIALLHVGKRLPWRIVSVVSFVAYALGHNIGVSVISSGVVRYRAYSRMGLSVGQVAIVTAFCAFTFAYGALFLGGIVLVGEPGLAARLYDLPRGLAIGLGVGMLALVVLYQLCSLLHLKPLEIRSFRVEYPRPAVAFRQLFAAPIEIIGAASIIYFALPDVGNPGYFVVLGIFLASFSAGLISNAPGGIGVFEFVFISAMPDIPKPEVLAALVMFRLLYLLVPLAMSCIIILVTERHSLSEVMALVAGRVRGPSAVLPAAQPDRPAE